MLYKFVFVFVFFMVLADLSPVQSRTADFEYVSLEESCVRQGGICAKEEDCDPRNIVTVGPSLCPLQHDLGIVCCYL